MFAETRSGKFKRHIRVLFGFNLIYHVYIFIPCAHPHYGQENPRVVKNYCCVKVQEYILGYYNVY